MSSRYIHSHLSSRQVPDLLQSIFIGELIAPSPCLWLVSPWISDISIIDNTANTFVTLEPNWSRAHIRLSQVLKTLAEQGTTLHIATRPDTHNRSFIEALKSSTVNLDVAVHFHVREELHAKGILGERYYLAGSMNFTYNGITLNEEALNYVISPEIIAEQQLIFQSRWGGAL